MVFRDRAEAGKKLAGKLSEFSGRSDVLLYALPRGGVAVGVEVAKALALPLDVIVTRKIGAPSNEEYAIGALAETGEIVWNEGEKAANDPKRVERIVATERAEAARRVEAYRSGRALPSFHGKTVIIVDDGIATGLTMNAAVEAARHQGATRIIVSVPHGAKESLEELRRTGVEVIALSEPASYGAVGQFYSEFQQLEDSDVTRLLQPFAYSYE
ncbi:phosphoribosyl transferase [Candidatus Uhrbacteria bacterium]|nr:phosphoribosyl transferase [Candidatus Uhrbacteria bacterium]